MDINEDAEKHDIQDNDWLEAYNRNGVVTARAVISHRMPKGTMFMYHAQDKHIQTPGSEITDTRGGSHNAPTENPFETNTTSRRIRTN